MANATPAHSFAANSSKFETPQAKFVLGFFDGSPDQIGTRILSTKTSIRCFSQAGNIQHKESVHVKMHSSNQLDRHPIYYLDLHQTINC